MPNFFSRLTVAAVYDRRNARHQRPTLIERRYNRIGEEIA